MNASILALGDCNTLGETNCIGQSFADRFARKIDCNIKNCGYTMSTTEEMIHFFNHFFSSEIKIILIQYGLVDSWKTFQYSPQILYYPDNIGRKIGRKIIKKYKKIMRSLGLNTLLGEKNLVSPQTYRENLQYIITHAPNAMIFLIDTVPNHQEFRNHDIKFYNEILTTLSEDYSQCIKVNIYDMFEQNLSHFYSDSTHINENGHEYIADVLTQLYLTCKKDMK
jgi:hypothetical protein